jgi:uridine kinase
MTNDELTAYIVEHITRSSLARASTFRVAITGIDCAGKSTLALSAHQHLTSMGFTARIVSIDDFLQPLHVKARRAPEFLGYFEDAFDYAALIRALDSSSKLKQMTPTNSMGELNSAPITLVEGVFLLREELRKWWDFAIWLEIDPALVLERALRRDVGYFGDENTVRQVYEARCYPAQVHHELRDNPKAHAQLKARFEDGGWSLQT